MTDLRKITIQSTSYLCLSFHLNLLDFYCLGNVVMGFFMAVIALILGFIFRYAKEIFSAETLTELKGILIAML